MSLKLKLDDGGKAEVRDGKVVVINEKDEEVLYDINQQQEKISELNQENATRRHENTKLKDNNEKLSGELEPYKELGPATEVKAKLEAKGKGGNEDVEKLKTDNASLTAKVESLENQLTDERTKSEKLTGDIFQLTVGSEFAKSPFLEKKTTLPPRHAQAMYGHLFKVEEHDGQQIIVGYLNGQPIFSRDPERSGKFATFDEALSIIVSQDPDKDRILKAGDGGAGGRGNEDLKGPQFGDTPRTDAEKATYIEKHGLDNYKKLVSQAAADKEGK